MLILTRRSQTTSPRSPRRPTAPSPTLRSASSTDRDTPSSSPLSARRVPGSDSCSTGMWPVRSWPSPRRPESICWLASAARQKACLPHVRSAALGARCSAGLIARNDERAGGDPGRRLRLGSDPHHHRPGLRRQCVLCRHRCHRRRIAAGRAIREPPHRDPIAVDAIPLGHDPADRGSP